MVRRSVEPSSQPRHQPWRVMSEVAVAERFGERHRLSSLPFGYLIEVGQTTMTAGPLDLYV
jgi:hypothetical protein